MTDSSTSNFGWVYPTVGADVDTWGSVLNASMIAQDVVVGSISTSLSRQSTSVAATSNNLTSISTSLASVSSSLTSVSGSVASLSTSVSGQSTSLVSTSTSLASQSSSVANIATSLGNVSTSLSNVSTSLAESGTYEHSVFLAASSLASNAVIYAFQTGSAVSLTQASCNGLSKTNSTADYTFSVYNGPIANPSSGELIGTWKFSAGTKVAVVSLAGFKVFSGNPVVAVTDVSAAYTMVQTMLSFVGLRS